MSLHWRRDEARGVTVISLPGPFASDPDSEAAAAALLAQGAWRGARVLVDMRDTDIASVPGYSVLSGRVHRWVSVHGLPTVAAILTTEGVAYGIGRVLQGTAATYGLLLSVFTDEQAAWAWLQSVEAGQAPDDPAKQ